MRAKPTRVKGYIRARGPDRWQVVVNLPRTAGKRTQFFETIKGTREDAEARLKELGERRKAKIDPRTTVAAYLDFWIEYKTTNDDLRASTTTRYKQILDTHVIPLVGKMKIAELRRTDINRIYTTAKKHGNVKTGGGLSAQSVTHIHRVLFAALQDAVIVHEVLEQSPCPKRKQRTNGKEKMRALDRPELLKLISTSVGTRLHTPILIAASVGLRRGEVLGLKWTDISFSKNTVSVARSLQPDLTIVAPKTDAGRRTVHMPADLAEALRRHKAEQNERRLATGAGYKDQGFVFTDIEGGPWKPASIATLFRSIAKRSGLGHLRFHDLRHTCASLLLDARFPITTVAQIMGHASAAVTASIYAHAIPKTSEDAAVAMDGILKGAASSR
jgi:integrase